MKICILKRAYSEYNKTMQVKV